jgi:hypothetical protein
MFLLLQAHILVTFFRCVFIIPNSRSCCSFQLCSCCSKLVFKCCFSRLCYYCSKLVFECCSSQLCSTPSSHFLYLKPNILRKTFHVAFGFLIFCFVFWPLFFNLLAIGLSRWLFLLCPLDAATLQGYPLLLTLLMLLLFQNCFYFGLLIAIKSSLSPPSPLPPFHLDLV